jgi:membrane-bound lytic murein transglycosylase D
LKTYWALVRTSHLPVETKNYVGKFLAGMMMAKHPEVFGFAGLEYDAPFRFDVADLPRAVSLRTVSRLTGVSVRELADLNPQLRMGITPPGKTYALRLSPGKASLLLQRLAEAPREVLPSPERYRIRPGDTLSGIAQRFNVSLKQLLELNVRLDPRRLQIGALVNLPGSGAKAEDEVPIAAQRETHHVVGPGESIWTISRRYGVSPEDIIRWNSLSTSAVIFPGDRLLVRR